MNMRQLLIAVLLSTLAAAQPSAEPKSQVSSQAGDAEAGYQHVKRKQFASAAKRLSAAAARDPENMQLRMDLAYAYQAIKKHGAAMEQFRIVASKPGPFQAAAATAAESARKQRGYLNFEEGRYAAAAADFEAALALRPDDHVTALQLGYTFERLKKRERARESFTAALRSGDDKIREAAQNALQATADGGSPAAPL